MTFINRGPARTLDGFDRLLGVLLMAVAWLLAGWGWIELFGATGDDSAPLTAREQTVSAPVQVPLVNPTPGSTATTAPVVAAEPTSDSNPVVETATAEPAPAALHCAPGQQPQFVLGFADLKRHLGAAMGEPLECEHANPENGDTLQRTSTGLAYYRKATNTATFTNGWEHWALTAEGLVTWTGEDVDPPSD